MSMINTPHVLPGTTAKKRDADQKRRRNELTAQQRREKLGGKMPSYIPGLSRVMSSEDARQRSAYLNSLLKRP
jgi:hypothetical protein